jgi:hypothetical protein
MLSIENLCEKNQFFMFINTNPGAATSEAGVATSSLAPRTLPAIKGGFAREPWFPARYPTHFSSDTAYMVRFSNIV